MKGARGLLVLLVVVTAAIWGAMQVFASGGSRSTSGPVTGHNAPAAGNPEVFGAPLKTYVNQSSSSQTVGPGFQPVDAPTRVTCVTPAFVRGASCTLEADQNVQVTGSAPNNRWAICTQVDGVFALEPTCPFLGIVPTTPFQAGSFMQTMTGLDPGPHTVQTFLYSDAGANRSIYTLVYRIYAVP